jgi:hypothetical protein
MLPLLLLILQLLVHQHFPLQIVLLPNCSPPCIRINPNESIASHYQRVVRGGGSQRLCRMRRHVRIAEFGPEPQRRMRVQPGKAQQRCENRLVPSAFSPAGSLRKQAVDDGAALGRHLKYVASAVKHMYSNKWNRNAVCATHLYATRAHWASLN